MTFHQTIVVGNLGRDPELRYLPSGTAVCNFPIAVNEYWTDRQTNERQEKTTWYRISVFGSQAENCAKYLSKGRQAMVIGTVEARGYTNNAGEAAASLDLRARSVQFLSGGDTSGGQSYDGGDYDSNMGNEGGPTDPGDIPF
jgi:single-strand DNA-binding protein